MKSVKSTTALGYMGFHIPPEMAQCIRLYAHSQDLSISQVLRSIIRSWITDNCITEEIMMDEMVSLALKGWSKKQFIDPSSDFHQFKKHWLENLNKKLPDAICDQIVKKFNRRIKPT